MRDKSWLVFQQLLSHGDNRASQFLGMLRKALTMPTTIHLLFVQCRVKGFLELISALGRVKGLINQPKEHIFEQWEEGGGPTCMRGTSKLHTERTEPGFKPSRCEARLPTTSPPTLPLKHNVDLEYKVKGFGL